MPRNNDLIASADVVRLVDSFYDAVRQDEMLGPIFNDVAQVDWAVHLPRMYAFWESVLFGAPGFNGNPMAVHRELAGRRQLTGREFDRWLQLFHASVDAAFTGPRADEAKRRATRIAQVMQHYIAGAGGLTIESR